jgi:hypothetical protein
MPSPEKSDRVIMNPFEDAPWIEARALLARRGFVPPAPSAVDDQELRGRLWELIYAMAGQRFYLACTDHLSDRELHQWLHDHWLQETAADIPPDAEWNARISPVSDGTEEEGTIVWLRYYADEEERQQFSVDEIPPHEDPRHDRDRFLPDAPLPCGTLCDGDECDEISELPLGELDVSNDPLGLEAVDAAIRNDREHFESGGMGSMEEIGASKEHWQQPLKLLQREGVRLLPPDEHTDETIVAGVWELLHELACRGFYVLHTDHLTDRELYRALWKDSLREPAMLPGRSFTSAWYHDFIGSGNDTDEELRLSYYATDEQRSQLQMESPGLALPTRKTPVASRDWRLPRGPI